ncbi:MAG TPA: cupin domain-containing protein [Vicinamibacterales bacterium]|nr:cupin domain-containing protein [Vicinamibacterales bacterium]
MNAAAAVVLLAVASHAFAQEHHVVVPPDKIQWGPAPPVLPAGAQIAVLEGNPAEKGAVVLRLKFPSNYAIPPHWHTMTERITVLSGDFRIGSGDALDKNASQTLTAGGYVSLPGKMHHYAWTRNGAVVQLNLEGPFDIFYINPSDDPQKKVVSR